ncbi:hypothetical protein [Ferdinandcohnia sp. Marseille-Q9671]
MSCHCWWCDETIEEDKVLIRSYPGVTEEPFCPSCTAELDQWSKEKWDRHYDFLLEDYGGWTSYEPKRRRTCRIEGCDGISEPDEDYCDEHIREP